MLESFSLSTFSPHIGDPFRILLNPAESLELTLTEAVSLASRSDASGKNPARAAREPFSLTFLGSKDNLLPQAIYTFEHQTIGTFEMFIVPIGRDEDGLLYEAVFA